MKPNSQTSAPNCTMSYVPPLNEDVNEDSDPQGEQDQTSRLTKTHHRHQDHHLNANSKHRRHLRQGNREPPPQQARQTLEKLVSTLWEYLN